MEFDKRKTSTLASLSSSTTDKSPKGSLDEPIIPLINTINQNPNFFTTSSCSGRVSILSQPKQNLNSKKKARGGSWIYITHNLADVDSVLSLLFDNGDADGDDDGELVLRFEPLIVAIECRDLESAQGMVALAIRCGFRESGITSANGKRVIVGVRCSIRMEVPLGERRNVLASKEYVRFLVEVANEKMEANRRRTEVFHLALVREWGHDDEDSDSMCDHDKDQKASNVNGVLNVDNRADHCGTEGLSVCSLSITPLMIAGEPIEKLFLWGHSACALNNSDRKEIFIFGGFGGMGRHERKNDAFLLDPSLGTLQVMSTKCAPSPRLGHTSSLVRDNVFMIGGRADPLNILNDVWVFSTAMNEWKLAGCSGDDFLNRHRHASAVIGADVYVFGGLNNDRIFSSLHVLNTDSLQWKELSAGGEWPCARHSHAMVSCKSHLYVFGGYNDEMALGDFYSFDVKKLLWKKENPTGKFPHARFSHSMFVYKNYVGVIGGCPVSHNLQELVLLDLHLNMWKHVTLSFIGKELFVRSSSIIINDDLVMVGGGAACYAFGTKFSEPLKINLAPLVSAERNHLPLQNGKGNVSYQRVEINGVSNENINVPHLECAKTSVQSHEIKFQTETLGVTVENNNTSSHWILQLEKKNAKLAKDILKKFGWLDLGRKVYSREDGKHICFPVTQKFCAFLCESQTDNDLYVAKPVTGKDTPLNEMSCLTALELLKQCGATKLVDEIAEVRKTAKSPLLMMTEAVSALIECKALSSKLLEQLPTRWDRLGDITVLPENSFKDPEWDLIREELWPAVAKALNTRRLARQGRVAPTGTRDSTLEILVGDDGWVYHRENGILYSFDATKCMFSWGNLSEKLRMARMDCRDEVVVDLFAGIGYFVLPFLVGAKAKLVYACEWNRHAVEALHHNLLANSVSDRCIVLEGDNRTVAPKGVANRVNLGLIPSSEISWVTAVRALRSEGGMLHVHGNVKDSEEDSWKEHVLKSFYEIAKSEGLSWEVCIEHIERVKWYAPHIRHLVADVRCRQI
ncbi:hypothetical protein ACFE04_002285 [Oxalis oulophora]